MPLMLVYKKPASTFNLLFMKKLIYLLIGFALSFGFADAQQSKKTQNTNLSAFEAEIQKDIEGQKIAGAMGPIFFIDPKEELIGIYQFQTQPHSQVGTRKSFADWMIKAVRPE